MIGYVRLNIDVSAEDMSSILGNVAQVYKDIGGVDVDHRPEFERALENISDGDEVIIYQLSQLGNNLINLHERINKMLVRGAKIFFIKEDLTLSKEDLEERKLGFYSSLELLSEFLSICRDEQKTTHFARSRKRREEFSQSHEKKIKEQVQEMIIEGKSDKEIADKLDLKLSLIFSIRRGFL